MPVLYLTEHDVEQLLDMRTAIETVEEAFRQLADGKAMNVPRVRAKAPGIVLHSMSAAAEYLGLVGWKNYTTTQNGAQFLVGLYDAQTGETGGADRSRSAGPVSHRRHNGRGRRMDGQFGSGRNGIVRHRQAGTHPVGGDQHRAADQTVLTSTAATKSAAKDLPPR